MSKKNPSEFYINVVNAVQAIPKGKVATYGQVARIAGKEHAARAVSWVLHSSSKKHKLPWHRVINSKGSISFQRGSTYYSKQKRFLRQEGVEFDQYGKLDLLEYQWKKGLKLS